MEFVKKHKFYIIGGLIFLVIMGLAIFAVCELVLPNAGESVYGNRLDGIDDVKVSDDTIKRIEQELEQNENVNAVDYHLSGRIMNFIIDVKQDTDLITAVSYADKTLEFLSDEEKQYYDIQVFLTCDEDEESELYPYIGYKHKTSVGFQWNYHE